MEGIIVLIVVLVGLWCGWTILLSRSDDDDDDGSWGGGCFA